MKTLRLILGDQLTHTISSLQGCDKAYDIILMCELWDEATYVKHHKKKIAFLFSAMRHFANELRDKGYKIEYISLNDENNSSSFTSEVKKALQRHADVTRIIVTFPGEYRVLKMIESWKNEFSCGIEICEDDRFLSTPDEFAEWADGRKELRMEYFYRQMRKKYSILMNDAEPAGGKWNYDKQNRKPPKSELSIPAPYTAQTDEITREVIEMVAKRFDSHFGDLEPFYFAVTRQQALYCLDKFVEERLHQFGDYQDAMIQNEPWIYHSHISFYLNCGLLTPLEAIEKAENAYHHGDAPLNAVEGFIRQILGWREYIRGMYWLNMPDYRKANFLNAKRSLPDFYWTGETKMNCIRQCVTETKENAYAHHIQRLMVLGNFALLAGIHPDQVNEWYLIVYADAYEWVEMPNVTGMILYADGGKLSSKPYAAGGSYINKMSDYCKGCSYKVSKKNGDDACPFNYLYWDFLARNRSKLKDNQRIGMMYATFDRMNDEKQAAIRDDSQRFFSTLKSDY